MNDELKTLQRQFQRKARRRKIQLLLQQAHVECLELLASATEEDACQEAQDALQDAEGACAALLADLQAAVDAACGTA